MSAPVQTNPNPGMLRLGRWVGGYAFRRWPQTTGVGFTVLLGTALNVLKPWPLLVLVDYGLKGLTPPAWLSNLLSFIPAPATPANLVTWSVLATILLFLLNWAVSLANAYANVGFAQRVTFDLAGDLFARLQQLSLRFHSSRSVGDNIRRIMADSSCVAVILKDAFFPVISSLVTLVTTFLIMWNFDATLTLLALVVVPYMVVVFSIYARPMMERSYEQQMAEARTYEYIEQTFSAIPLVQAFGRESANDREFAGINRKALSTILTALKVQLRFKILLGLGTAVGTAAILWIGTKHALAGELSIGGIILFLSYLASLYGPLEWIMYSGTTLQTAAGSARRVLEVMEKEREVVDAPGAVPVTSPRGQLTFEKVSFGYEPGRKILDQISLQIESGETIALVGPTGAGKTTLASLVPRFYDPWEGTVRLDGRDLREFQVKSLRRQVAVVLQEPFLFPISIAENIAYGRPDATPEEIESVARTANAHEFIMRLPGGYNSVVGERGATLSGGERQRISIARALMLNAPILILDEPTSALDVETESAFLQALERLTRDRTTLIIAHRLSTIRRANRIVVLEQGRVVETGTHDELLARGQLYARFYQLQFGATAPPPEAVA